MPESRAERIRRRLRDANDVPTGTIIPVHSKRLNQASFTMGLMRELPAVFTVFAAGASALQGEHDGAGLALAAGELIAGAAVLVAIAMEARHLFGRQAGHSHAAPHPTPRFDASSLAAAALGYVESWHRTHVDGHFKLVSPQIVGATVSLFMAFIKQRPASQRRLRRRPHVGITPAGISYLGGLRRRWKAEWADVAAVEHHHGELAIRLHDGRRHVLSAEHHLDGERILAETRMAITAHAPHIPHAATDATVR